MLNIMESRRKRNRKSECIPVAGQGSESILDCRTGTILLLGGLHVHVDIYNGTVAANVFGTPAVEVVKDGVTHWVLDTQSSQYQTAGDWVGILFAVQAIGSVIWAAVMPSIPNRKFAYALSLVLGGIGFISISFTHDQYMMFIPFLLIGCAWAAMLAMPFTILTNALTGGHMGTYLGLFNGTICVPQIVALLQEDGF